MTRERERTNAPIQPTTTKAQDGDPGEGGGLLRQVRALEEIARQAHESCVHGVDVERELAARRNAGGE